MYYVNFDAYESQAIFLINNFFFCKYRNSQSL